MVLARLALDRRDYGEAERQLAIQTYLDPEEVGLAGMLAETFAAQGKFAEAIPYLQKNLREHPNDPSAVGNLGMALQMIGRTSEALANFEIYLSNFEEDPRIANNYAWLTATSDRPSRAELLKAVDLARRATASEPTSHRYRGTLSVALAAAGYEEEAERVADQALQMALDAGDEKSAKELALTLCKLKRDR
jgi:Flp pilus assembly protein TadD